MNNISATRYLISLYDISSEDYILVGENVYNDFYLSTSGITTPNGFVLTKIAFDDFLLDNESISSISKLLEKKNLKDSHLNEITNVIQKSIEDGRIREEIEDQLTAAVNAEFGIDKDVLVSLTPSFIFDKYPENNLNKSLLINVNNVSDVINGIKKVYASFYSPELIAERISGDFQLSCFAILIRAVKVFEVSGKAVLKRKKESSNDMNNRSLLEIYSEYGNYNDENEEAFPDKYIVDVESRKITQRTIMDQEIMYQWKDGKLSDIKVSFDLSGKQKLQDHKIFEIVDLIKKLDLIYKKDIEITWGYGKGKLYVVSISYVDEKEIKTLLTDVTEDYPEYIEDGIRRVEDTVISTNHISKRIAHTNLKSTTEALLSKESMLISRLRGGFNISTPLLKSKSNIYFEQERYNYTDSNVMRNANANAYINGSSILDKYNIGIEGYSRDLEKKIINELVLEIAQVSYQFSPKQMIYQISNVKYDSQNENFYRKVLTEAIALSIIREEYDYSNLSICLSNISTLKALRIILSRLEKIGIAAFNNVKVYCEVQSASILSDLDYQVTKRSDLNIEGFIVNIDKLISSIFGQGVMYEDDKDLFLKIFNENIEKLKEKNYKFIFKLANNSPDVLEEILGLNPYGIVIPYSRSEVI